MQKRSTKKLPTWLSIALACIFMGVLVGHGPVWGKILAILALYFLLFLAILIGWLVINLRKRLTLFTDQIPPTRNSYYAYKLRWCLGALIRMIALLALLAGNVRLLLHIHDPLDFLALICTFLIAVSFLGNYIYKYGRHKRFKAARLSVLLVKQS